MLIMISLKWNSWVWSIKYYTIILLTSKDDEVDELLGLKLGADDYVKKSGGFSVKVLIERIRVQFRKLEPKTASQPKNILTVGIL